MKRITRREFLKKACLFVLGLGASPFILEKVFKTKLFAAGVPFKYEARFYKKIDDKTVQCQLCPRGCTLSNGQRSFCRAREPKEGKLYSLVYAQVCAAHIDPIEKKPLFHFLPGTPIYSIATAGCNFRCKYCQNWSISQIGPEEAFNSEMSPQEVVRQAMRNNCPSLAYTYTEPSIFYEYMLDTAREAKLKGLKNMYHSNGSLNQKPVEELSLYLDAADIDLKGFTEGFYSDVCAGYLDTVLNTLKVLKRNKVWLELTNLVVPTLNDEPQNLRQMVVWIKENLGDEVPIHFSRFQPLYKLANLYPTPVSTLEKAHQIATDVGLKFVYIGNVPGHPAENTYCPKCKKVVIRRVGYTILENNLKSGNCKFCGRPIPGVWA
jgi:pyruvate formate lyase activating enzyme